MNKTPILLILFCPACVLAGLLSDQKPAPQKSRALSAAPAKLFDPQSMQNSHLWIEVDALIWQASEDALEYATTSKAQDSVQDGRIKSPDFEWEGGFRVGLGIKLPYDGWDLFLNYTHVEGKARGQANAPEGGAVFPLWMAPFNLPQNFFVEHAKTNWRTLLNIADVELGRGCLVSKWVSIRPFMCVRAAWIDQALHVDYTGGNAVPAGDRDQLRFTNDFWGVGLRVGFDSLWGLGKGFGIYGNGGASLLAGDFTVRQKEKLKEADLTRLELKADTSSVVAGAELALGFQWDKLLSQDRYHLGLKLGWELNLFFDQNRLVHFLGGNPGSISQSNADLSFQGLTVGFRFDF
jgi:hypothetical protein